MKYTLSKKSIFIILLFTSIVMGGFVLLNSSRSPLNNSIVFEMKINENTTKTLIKTLETDTDNDGLKDWEESLWKTDPKNPDTDGDGMSDGEEIRTNRDPLKQGEGDKKEQQNKYSPKTTPYEEFNTATDAVIDNFISKYFEIKNNNNGGKLDEKSKTELINSTLSGIITENAINTYTKNNLNITSDSSDGFKNYGNTLASILSKYLKESTITENEILVINKAFEMENMEYLKKLSPAILKYKNAAKEISEIEIPASVAKTHLNIINTYESIALSLEDIKKTPDDPILGLTGMARYNKYMEQMSILSKELSDMFYKNNISFEEKEFGSMLLIKTN